MTLAATTAADLRRWAASAAVVVAIHAGGALMLTRWVEPVAGDEGTATVAVDLAPFTTPQPDAQQQDVAPGPLQQQAESPPEPPPPKPEEKKEEKAEPPPEAPAPEVVLPRESEKPLEPPKEQPAPPVPETTAPPRPRPSAAQVSSWHRQIAMKIERHKRYPTAAQARRETGTARVAFTIDREGQVLTSRVVTSSGSTALDQETIATLRRAQPFPPPPAGMPDATFDFVVPIRFKAQ
jgi:periplasmic protein TonB